MARLGPFDAARAVVVAVSGGADSMALATLLAGWGRPLAAIVDHGLRADSAAEAALTARRLDALGVPAIVLPADLRPGPAQSERARAARYRLLLDYCRSVGRPDLLLAHHAHDQAETVAMRAARGSGPAGLAGMQAIDARPEARLLRPLLAIVPTRLRATLAAAGIAWVEDPTNADRRTARGDLRATLTDAARRHASARAAAAASRRGEAEREAAIALADAELWPQGFAIVDREPPAAALSALIWAISGRLYPPPPATLAAGLAPRTVHGALIRPAGRLGPGTLIAREPAAVAAPIPATDGCVWDGRFRLRGPVPGGLTIGALGAGRAGFRRRLPASVLATLPALHHGDRIVAVPHLAYADDASYRSLCVDFWPARPVAPAPFGLRVNLVERPGDVD